jgi:hypothetical protein
MPGTVLLPYFCYKGKLFETCSLKQGKSCVSTTEAHQSFVFNFSRTSGVWLCVYIPTCAPRLEPITSTHLLSLTAYRNFLPIPPDSMPEQYRKKYTVCH